MNIDRSAQQQLLQALAQIYPADLNLQGDIPLDMDAQALLVQLAYLEDHGLLVVQWSRAFGYQSPISARITARGLDFLADDGGLSAILGVVTVRLHDDTIKALIQDRIERSDLPQPEKQRYLDRLRSLPADATKHLVLKLLEKGLDRWQDAAQLLETSFRSLA